MGSGGRGADADPGRVGDLLGRSVDAGAGEHRLGGVEQILPLAEEAGLHATAMTVGPGKLGRHEAMKLSLLPPATLYRGPIAFTWLGSSAITVNPASSSRSINSPSGRSSATSATLSRTSREQSARIPDSSWRERRPSTIRPRSSTTHNGQAQRGALPTSADTKKMTSKPKGEARRGDPRAEKDGASGWVGKALPGYKMSHSDGTVQPHNEELVSTSFFQDRSAWRQAGPHAEATTGLQQQPWIDRRATHRRTSSDPIDRILRNSKLHRLHECLRLRVETYVALCEAGSLAAGDAWVDGRSDRDVQILIDGPMTAATKEMLQAELRAIGFNDSYLFHLAQKKGFLKTRSDHDISMKFRGVALFGENVLGQKETPPREFAQRWADAGLRTMPPKLRIRVLNAQCWSVERLRDEIYCDFKLMFMFLADKKYAETGTYPRRRADVADAYGSAELKHLANSLSGIDQADVGTLVSNAKLAITALQQLI